MSGTTAQTPTVISGSSPATTATVAGLINGTEYTFTVVAANSVGNSPNSAASNPVTPGALPTAPTGVTATADDSSATVTWNVPGSDGGSPIISYIVTPFVGSTAQTPTIITGAPPNSAATVVGLTAGTSYTFRVTAASVAGTGAAAASAAVTVCPCTLLAGGVTPIVADSGDASALSVGLLFTASENGFITGLRYYRSAANTGVHTGTLWTSDGTALASLTYPDTDPGWQTATFSSPWPSLLELLTRPVLSCQSAITPSHRTTLVPRWSTGRSQDCWELSPTTATHSRRRVSPIVITLLT